MADRSHEALKRELRQALAVLLEAVEAGRINQRDLERLMQQWPSPPGLSKAGILQQLRAMTPAQREALVDQVAALMSGDGSKGLTGLFVRQLLKGRRSHRLLRGCRGLVQ